MEAEAQRRRERQEKRERWRRRDGYGTEDATNGSQKRGEMSHVFVVGATVGPREKNSEGERGDASESADSSNVDGGTPAASGEGRRQVQEKQPLFHGQRGGVGGGCQRWSCQHSGVAEAQLLLCSPCRMTSGFHPV